MMQKIIQQMTKLFYRQKVAGVLENNTGKGGYKTTTYSEKVQEVADLPEGMTKDTVTLTDVLEGTISMEQFVASLSVEEMAKTGKWIEHKIRWLYL